MVALQEHPLVLTQCKKRDVHSPLLQSRLEHDESNEGQPCEDQTHKDADVPPCVRITAQLQGNEEQHNAGNKENGASNIHLRNLLSRAELGGIAFRFLVDEHERQE